jgi:nitrogen regulatory protein P-II
MKLLMIILDESVRDEVESVLEGHGVNGYTEIPMVLGEGLSGKKLSSRLHPGANSIVFTIIDDSKLEEIRSALLTTCTGRMSDFGCPKPIHIAVLKVEEFL